MSNGISTDLVRKTLAALGFSFDQKLEDEVVCSLLSQSGTAAIGEEVCAGQLP